MRQVFLVIVLVGSAFLGGAFVNGPGMHWVQTQVMGSMGLEEGGEIATVDLKAGGEKDREAARGPSTKATEPATKPTEPRRRPGRREGDEEGPSASPSPLAPVVPPELLGEAGEAPAPESRRRPDAAPRDPDVTRAAASAAPAMTAPSHPGDEEPPAPPSPTPATEPAPSPSSPPALTPPGPIPMPMPAPTPTPAPVPAPTSPRHGGDEDWALLARKMQEMGISRYSVEGQPGGRAVFSCLIPMAGRQAVTQRFEAEGDDAIQAARAALRRIALWRAAQPSPPPSR